MLIFFVFINACLNRDNILKLKEKESLEVEINDEKRCSEIITAANNSDLDMLRGLLDEGLEVDYKDKQGSTALIIASELGNTEIVKELLSRGADINIQNNLGITSLMGASLKGREDIVDVLLEAGANISLKTYKSGYTALMYAAKGDNLKMVEILLKAGSDVSIQLKNGISILNMISNKEILETVRSAIDGSFYERDANLLVSLAMRDGRDKVIELLDQGLNVDLKTRGGRTALMSASSRNNVEMMNLLIARGAKIDEKDLEGNTSLILAAFLGYLEALELLIERGAKIDQKDRYGNTALMFAIQGECPKVVDLLIERGATVDVKNEKWQTPLIMAVHLRNIEVVNILLDKVTKVDDTDSKGITAMMVAANTLQENLVIALMNKGAEVDKKDNNGKTALMYVLDNKGEEDRFFKLSEMKNIIELLIVKGTNVNEKDLEGKTALMYMAKNGNRATAELLINQGAKISEKDRSKKTVLMWAAKEGNKELVEMLIEKNVDLDEIDENGWTAAMYASANKEKWTATHKKRDRKTIRKLDILIMLLKSGADINIKSKDGATIGLIVTEMYKSERKINSVNISDTKKLLKELKSLGANFKNKLMQLCCKGYLVEVKNLLDDGYNLEDKDPSNGKTALMYAVDSGNIELVDFLINTGADIEALNYDNRTALMVAANNGNKKMVEMLINRGADIKETVLYTNGGILNEALSIFSVKSRSVEIVEFLLSLNKMEELKYLLNEAIRIENLEIIGLISDKDIIDEYRIEDILYLAVSVGNTEILKFFLNLFNKNIVSLMKSIGYILLNKAIEKDFNKIAEILIEHGALSDESPKENTLSKILKEIIIKDKRELIEFLIARGIDINRCEIKSSWETLLPITLSIRQGNIKMVELLLDNGADIDIALTEAIKKRNNEIVQLLIGRGANIIYSSNSTKTMLLEAIVIGNRDIVKMLIENGVCHEIEDERGNTPLMLVAEKGDLEIVKSLLDFGCKINEKNKKGDTVLVKAICSGNRNLVDFIMQKEELSYENIGKLISFSLSKGYDDLFEEFIEKVEDFSSSEILNENLLSLAAYKKNKKAMKILIEKGLDVNYKPDRGLYGLPLIEAIESNYIEGIKLLVKEGAKIDSSTLFEVKKLDSLKVLLEIGLDLDLKDKFDDNTVLIRAVKNKDIDMVKFLVRAGASLDIKNKRGKTALMVAVEKQSVDLVRILLRAGANANVLLNVKGPGIFTLPLIRTLSFTRNFGKDIGANRDLETFELIVKEAINLNVTPTLMHEIVVNFYKDYDRDDSILKYAISIGGDINAKDERGYTLLHWIAFRPHSSYQILDFLLDNRKELKLKLEVEDVEGCSPLHILVKLVNGSGNFEVENSLLYKLIDVGLDPNARNINGETPLHIMAKSIKNISVFSRRINKDMIEKLVKISDTSIKDNNGITALHSAIILGKFDLLNELVDFGINLEEEDKYGRKPIHFIANLKKDRDEMMKSLEILLKAGVDLGSKCRNGRDILHYACCNGNVSLCEYLLEKGFDMNIKNEEAKSSIHYAVENGHFEVVKFLIDSGVDVNVKDEKGRTALEIALMLSNHSNNDMVNLLKDKSEVKNIAKSLLQLTIAKIEKKVDAEEMLRNKRIVESIEFVDLIRHLIRLKFDTSEIKEISLVVKRIERFKNSYMYELFMDNSYIEEEIKEYIKLS